MFNSEAELEAALSEPSESVIRTVAELNGDFILLGVAGKMGFSLARMIRRAVDAAGSSQRVIGVSRFSSVHDQAQFASAGIDTIRCDLLDETAVDQLPEIRNVIAMAGMKFGATGNESLTWAMNTHLPAIICHRYRRSRIVAFSTGNVYGLSPVSAGGSREGDCPQPAGEYAMSCLGRERMYEHFSRTLNIPMALIRLNYACDLRYGVVVDLAQKILQGQPIDLQMGYFNTIWQGDANAWTLESFRHVSVPPWLINITGPEVLSVRTVAEQLAAEMGRPALFAGHETSTALLSHTDHARSVFGPLRMPTPALIRNVAQWALAGGRSLSKPTHFESRDGRF